MDLSRFRPNVGVVLFNAGGEAWLGRRSGTPGPHNWQFPQGGVDEGEDLYAAALRELREETGAHSVEPLGRTEDWLTYEYPPALRRSKAARGWLGQKQIWFALRFTGPETEFDLRLHPQIEFDCWRWATLDEALAGVVEFKRDVYAKVVDCFRPLIAG